MTANFTGRLMTGALFLSAVMTPNLVGATIANPISRINLSIPQVQPTQANQAPNNHQERRHIVIDALENPRDIYDALALIFAAFGTIFSFTAALLVYLFTARQAQNENLALIQNMWQQLNFAILTDNKSLHAYRTLFSVDSSIADEDVRLEYMTFIWINILYLQWRSMKQKLIVSDFAKKSLGDQFVRMIPQKSFVIQLLSERGYDAQFVEFVRASCARNP